MHRLHFLLRCLFSRSFRTAWPGRRRGAWRRRAGAGSFGDSRSAARHDSLLGFSGLESRAMLAADDVFVSLVGNQVQLGFDPAGTTITDLNTSYNAAANVLTITALTAGTISMTSPVSGITVDAAKDTIAVDLKVISGFAGISVAGGAGVDAVTIGSKGVNLAAVTAGASAQNFGIDTGAGATDRITVAAAVSSKGAGGVSLTTLGTGPGLGIQLAAGVTAPLGPQTFAGAVTLQNNTSLTAGGNIGFTSTLDGANRLTLSSGNAITFSGAIGGTTPLRGITLSAAKSAAFAGAMKLDGTGTGANTSGLVIGANVNNVVFSAASGSNARTIENFGGSGIQFVGGSTGSRITNVTSSLNRIGLQVGPGLYTGTVITGNSFSTNQSDGVVLSSARGILLGGAAAGAGNTIIFNGGYGLNATGTSTGSVAQGNQISNNDLGNVRGLRISTTCVAIAQAVTAPGLDVRISSVGLATLRSEQAGPYAFNMAFDINGVAFGSTGALDGKRGLVDLNARVQSQRTQFRQTGGVTYVNAPQLGATGTPWVSVTGSSDAAEAVNSLVAGLTPANVLESLQFPISSRRIGTDGYGQRFQAVIGKSTFATLLPLADLTELATSPTFGNDAITTEVWVNSQGGVSRFAVDVVGVGTITVSFSSYGRTVRVVAPSSAQTSGMESTSGRQLFADGAAGTTAGAAGGKAENVGPLARADGDFPSYERYRFGVAASYEIDLFGRVRDSVQAARQVSRPPQQ